MKLFVPMARLTDKITWRTLFDEGTRAWNLSGGWLLLIMIVPYIIALSGVIAALFGKDVYKIYTDEDGIVEYLQVLCWVFSFTFSVKIAMHQFSADEKTIAALFAFLSVFILFVIGEEISWGQRILGWGTPEALQAINKQDETNVHNIYGVGYAFKWLHLLVGAYGTFMPIVVLRSKKLARYRTLTSLFVPHYTLIPFFSLHFLWHVYRRFFSAWGQKHYFAVTHYTEVIELILASAIMFFLIFLFRQFKFQKLTHLRNKENALTDAL